MGGRTESLWVVFPWGTACFPRKDSGGAVLSATLLPGTRSHTTHAGYQLRPTLRGETGRPQQWRSVSLGGSWGLPETIAYDVQRTESKVTEF